MRLCRDASSRGLRRCRSRVALEDLPPAFPHLAAQTLGGFAEPLEVPVLEVDACRLGPEQGERYLDLREKRGVVLEVRTELPGEEQPARRIPRKHLAPLAGRAVLAEFVPTAVYLGLDHAVFQRGRANVMLLRPPCPHVLR